MEDALNWSSETDIIQYLVNSTLWLLWVYTLFPTVTVCLWFDLCTPFPLFLCVYAFICVHHSHYSCEDMPLFVYPIPTISVSICLYLCTPFLPFLWVYAFICVHHVYGSMHRCVYPIPTMTVFMYWFVIVSIFIDLCTPFLPWLWSYTWSRQVLCYKESPIALSNTPSSWLYHIRPVINLWKVFVLFSHCNGK